MVYSQIRWLRDKLIFEGARSSLSLIKSKQLNRIAPDEIPLLERRHSQTLNPFLPLIHHYKRVINRIQNVICTNLTGVKVQKISREIPRCCFVDIGFPIARESLVHWHTAANFAGKHWEAGGQFLPSSNVQREKKAKV